MTDELAIDSYLPPSPLATTDVRITAIETVQPLDLFPGLLFLRIQTDAGVVGHGETYYCAEAVQGMIHEWMARRLLGEDALRWPSKRIGGSCMSARPIFHFDHPGTDSVVEPRLGSV